VEAISRPGVFAALSMCASLAWGLSAVAAGAESESKPQGHYLFAWAGAASGPGEDFIAVIDADPASAHYGELVVSAPSGITTDQVHHTEYWMPDRGHLFANDHRSGDTVIFDLTQPLQPHVVLDLTAPGGPKEISRVVLDGEILPHWTGYDARTQRLAVSGYEERRVFMLVFDPESGALTLDKAFHDEGGHAGFDTASRAWPQGWTGTAIVHGIVFSR
jgi:hypothetical protein